MVRGVINMSANGLLETIKRAAVEAQGAGQPLQLCYGKVTSKSPLKITVENKLELTKEFLIVPEHLTDYEVKMTFDYNTNSAGEDSHSHTISGKKTVTVHGALEKDDKVMLLRMQGGQSYLVLCRL